MTDETKQAEEAAKPAETPADMVNVVTIGVGVLSQGGLTPIGTHAQIPVEAFSSAWMRPKNVGDMNKLRAAGKLPKLEKAKEKVAD